MGNGASVGRNATCVAHNVTDVAGNAAFVVSNVAYVGRNVGRVAGNGGRGTDKFVCVYEKIYMVIWLAKAQGGDLIEVIQLLPAVFGSRKVVNRTMGNGPKKNADDTQAIIDAWTELAPTATFNDMTLAQYTASVQPSLDSRKRIKNLSTDLEAEQVNRSQVDVTSIAVNAGIVKAVVADKNFGDDSALYERMGYIRKSNRASGLTHKTKPAPPAK
jgi:hypothetical protein